MEQVKKGSIKFLGLLAAAFMLTIIIGMTALAAPDKVKGLKQTESYGGSAASVTVAWDAAQAEGIRYWVEYSSNKVNWTSVSSVGTDKTERYIGGLRSGQTYYVRVAASVGYNGELGAWSDILTVATSPDRLDYNSIKQTNASTKSVTIQWNGTSGATHYRVYDYSNNVLGKQVGETSGTSLTIKGLKNDSVYTYVIKAVRSVGSYAAEASGLPGIRVRTVADAVKGVTVKNADPKRKTAYLSWKTKKFADGFEIQVYDNKGKKKVGKILKAGAFSSLIQLKGLKPTSFYQVKIRSYITVGKTKKYSAWTTTHTTTQPIVKASASGNNVKLSWKKVTGAVNYTVYGGKGKSSTAKYKRLGTIKSTSYTVSKVAGKKLERNNSYYFYVVANKKVKGKTYKSAIGYAYGGYYY